MRGLPESNPGMARPFSFSLSKQDWSLHRQGPMDQARHDQKVREAIKDNLAEIVSREAIITSDGDKIVKIPIRSLELPRFRHDERNSKHVGQGDGSGKSSVGDVIGHAQGEAGPGVGKRAGDQPGIDYYEAEITIDELAAIVFEDLGLPNLQPKQVQEIDSEAVRFNDVRKKGLVLDRHRTAIENIKRHALHNEERTFHDVKTEDLRYRTWERVKKPESNAVVIAMRDVSGSMGEFEKYITRSFYSWMIRFLRHEYDNVRMVFITHHTKAKEVDEQAFFTLGESGGTKISSAYELARGIIKERFSSERWNIYPFHFSDGDNWADSDQGLCVELVNQMLNQDGVNMFGYGEIQETPDEYSSMIPTFSAIKDERFVAVTIKEKEDVLPALKTFFRKEAAGILTK